MKATYAEFINGKRLIGDDFSPEEINAWFQDEENGYYNLSHNRSRGSYGYHALNWRHGFKHLPSGTFEHLLGIGSAFGDELEPILKRTKKVTILEPSDGFANPSFQYVKPNPSGLMPFSDGAFDVITCFGVLHHIPNVSAVFRELARCLKPKGFILVREPTHSLGNWDNPRPGLTRRERGIPARIMHGIIHETGLRILRERKCQFSATGKLQAFFPPTRSIYNSAWVTAVDEFISNLPIWSHAYHAENLWQRFRPWSLFLVATKGSEPYAEKS